MNFQWLRAFIFALASFSVALVFQNCSRPAHHDGVAEVASVDPFPYPYSKKQTFYANAILLAAKTEVESLSQFKVAASLAYADDPTQIITYNVMVQDANGLAACPSQSGVLNMGQSIIKFDCTSTVVDAELTVTIEATAAGINETFEFIF